MNEQIQAPTIDWPALSPIVALVGGACLVLMVGLLRSSFARRQAVPGLAILTLLVTAGLGVWQWGENVEVIERALAMDDLTLALTMIFCVSGIAAVLMAWRSVAAAEAGEGEFYALMLTSVLGMVVLVAAQNTVVLFVGFELLSIPLYVLCATHMRREHSLESGLKYLIIGSVGSATLLYGLALVYGATGATAYADIAAAAGELQDDVLLLTGVALVVTGLAFKASVAPFHQWTPDVYEGAPTPVTGFMAVATKAAAFGVLLRFFDVALIDLATVWGPALGVLAVVTIAVGNVGALGQSSLKRMLAYSSVAQAGYMLAGVLVSTSLGIEATIFYLAGYAVMNLAAFAVITARERESGVGDDISSLYGLGAARPWLAWPMTIAMLSLAGIPATVGFFGKLFLIQAAVDNDYGWVAVAIVLGSAISLAYYLRVIAAVWMRSPSEAVAARAVTPGGRPIMAGGAHDETPRSPGDPGDPGDSGDPGDRPAESGSGEPVEPDVSSEGEASAGEAGSHAAGEAGGAPYAGGATGAGGGTDLPARSERGGVEPVEPASDGPLGRRLAQPELVFVAVVCTIATVFFGLYPDPLFDIAQDAGAVLDSLV